MCVADECECGEESDEDVITDYLAPMEASTHNPSPLVPIISVTPHSPAGKNYPVLGTTVLVEIHFLVFRFLNCIFWGKCFGISLIRIVFLDRLNFLNWNLWRYVLLKLKVSVLQMTTCSSFTRYRRVSSRCEMCQLLRLSALRSVRHRT